MTKGAARKENAFIIKITVKTAILKEQPINFVYCLPWKKAAIEKQNLTEKKTLPTTKSATKFVHKRTLLAITQSPFKRASNGDAWMYETLSFKKTNLLLCCD